jgi:hypothetical protein
MYKKSTALLITLLIIASLGTMALIVARSAISGSMVNSRMADELVADEASFAGIELYLLRQPADGEYFCNLTDKLTSDNIENVCLSSSPSSIDPTKSMVDIEVGSAGTKIFSTGYFGTATKKHLFEIIGNKMMMVY